VSTRAEIAFAVDTPENTPKAFHCQSQGFAATAANTWYAHGKGAESRRAGLHRHATRNCGDAPSARSYPQIAQILADLEQSRSSSLSAANALDVAISNNEGMNAMSRSLRAAVENPDEAHSGKSVRTGRPITE